jgi:catechol 2,3-dioxygenase-like lactoylglutathione lyase family enzyme
MEPIDCLGFDHIDLTVNDLALSTEYYDRVLGRLGFEMFNEESASQSVIFVNGVTSIGIRPSSDER